MTYNVEPVNTLTSARAIRQKIHTRLLRDLQELVDAQRHEDAHYHMAYSDTSYMLKAIVRDNSRLNRAVDILENEKLI